MIRTTQCRKEKGGGEGEREREREEEKDALKESHTLRKK